MVISIFEIEGVADALAPCLQPAIDAINKNIEEQQMNDMNKQIGKNLNALRLSRGMSLEQLGHGMGVSFQQAQKNISGENKLGGHRLGAACIALECTPDDLYAGCLPSLPQKIANDAYARTHSEVELLRAVRKKDAKYVKALLEVVRCK